jgi:deoxyribose-phosphate aldolase
VNEVGATEHDIKLMRTNCSKRIQIKAAGGIRTLEQALMVRELGCTRLGCTATIEILEQEKQK